MNTAGFGCLGCVCVCVYLFGMYESSYAIIHKIGLYTLSLLYEREYS